MLARFFIDRPILAWVISVVIVLLGAIATGFLPIAEYPEITPPTVRVTANYPGANAQVVADAVAGRIEQQVVGVEGMLYMSSQSNNDGSYTLDVTFELGTNVNMAQVLVQNRVAIAEPTLPDVVRTIGVRVIPGLGCSSGAAAATQGRNSAATQRRIRRTHPARLRTFAGRSL